MVLCPTTNTHTLVPLQPSDKENATNIYPVAPPASSVSPRRRRAASPSAELTARKRRRHPAPTSARQSPSLRSTPTPAVVPPPTKRPEEPPVAVATPTAKIIFPRRLARPDFKPVPQSSLVAIDPELEGVPTQYLHDKLQPRGAKLLEILTSTSSAPVTGLPAEIEVLMKAMCDEVDMPTHMLAVHSKATTRPNGSAVAQGKRPVTLFPIHDIVLAAYCANLPPLPPSTRQIVETRSRPSTTTEDEAMADDSSDSDSSLQKAQTIKLPIVPLCIPNPPTFPILQSYLYTKRVDQLLARLLPAIPPSESSPASPVTPELAVADALDKLKSTFSSHYSSQALLQHTLTVHGLWSNICVLGITDERLWRTLDLAWDVLISSMAACADRAAAGALLELKDSKAASEDVQMELD